MYRELESICKSCDCELKFTHMWNVLSCYMRVHVNLEHQRGIYIYPSINCPDEYVEGVRKYMQVMWLQIKVLWNVLSCYVRIHVNLKHQKIIHPSIDWFLKKKEKRKIYILEELEHFSKFHLQIFTFMPIHFYNSVSYNNGGRSVILQLQPCFPARFPISHYFRHQ